MKRLFPLLVVSLLSAACGDAPTTSDVNVAEPEDAVLLAADEDVTLDVPYGNCPNPQSVCSLYHEGSTATSWCTYEACFEMSYGGEVRVVAADDLGNFPRKFFAWHTGMMTEPAPPLKPCYLTERGKKTVLEIQDTQVKCAAVLNTTQHLYYEHYVSNPTTGCFAWLECKAKAP